MNTVDKILEYMINGDWKDDNKINRKIELWNLAKESRGNVEISHKIGGLDISLDIFNWDIKNDITYIETEST